MNVRDLYGLDVYDDGSPLESEDIRGLYVRAGGVVGTLVAVHGDSEQACVSFDAGTRVRPHATVDEWFPLASVEVLSPSEQGGGWREDTVREALAALATRAKP